MVGNLFAILKARKLSMVCVAVLGLSACDENGQFLQPSAADAPQDELIPANAPNQVLQRERDTERPDIFEVTDSGLWDGRPSLGGVWVAHPDAQDPERVLIRNSENGRTIIGALFRRERDNPGPLLQVSSDAADELGILAGAPTPLSVVALRRVEVEVAAPVDEANPVVAGLAAPVAVEAAPLDPAPVDAEASTASAVTLPPALEAATAAAEATAATAVAATAVVVSDAAPQVPATEPAAPIDVSAVLNAPIAPANGPRAQVGIYSVEANADAAVTTMNGAGIAAEVLSEDMGGRTVWRVVAGPLVDETMVAQLKQLGFVDAFIIEAE